MSKIHDNCINAKETLIARGSLPVKFKWSISRGYNTYGYNICSLVTWNNCKLGSCNGGGYDMKGTALAGFLNVAFKDELIALNETLARDYNNRGYNGYSDGLECDLYGFCKSKGKDAVWIDGGCGITSVIRIMGRLGYRFRHVMDDVYEIVRKEV